MIRRYTIWGPIKNTPVRISGDILLCPSSTEHKGWKAHMERYNIVKDSWDDLVSVDPNSVYNVIQPTILQHSEGTIQILCRSREGFIMTSSSKDGGTAWNRFEQTCLPNPNSGIDAVTLKNGRQVLVVITSYSIHYTKLYDNRDRWTRSWPGWTKWLLDR